MREFQIVRLSWQPSSEKVLKSRGVYLFCFKSFGNIPYYVGTAEHFGDRIGTHKNNYMNGLYTFVREEFCRRFGSSACHTDYANLYARSQSENLIFVPGDKDVDFEQIKTESANIWKNEVSVFFAEMPDASEDLILQTESRLQYDLEDYYRSLSPSLVSFKIPRRGSRSTYFGKRERSLESVSALHLRHDLNSISGCRSQDFFRHFQPSAASASMDRVSV